MHAARVFACESCNEPCVKVSVVLPPRSDMRLTYVVLLKPCEIRLTKNILAPIFDNGIPLLETLEQLENGEIASEDIPSIEVVFYQEKWEWYTLNNRRLWVFQELERKGKVKHIKTKRFENVEHILDYPTKLYETARLSQQSYSFSWRGERLEVTRHGGTTEHEEADYIKEERRENTCRELVPRTERSVVSRSDSAKSHRKKFTTERYTSSCEDEEADHIQEKRRENTCRDLVPRTERSVVSRSNSAKSPRKKFKAERYHPYSSNSSASKQIARRSRRLSETGSTLSTSSTGSRFHLAAYKFSLSEWLWKRGRFFRYVYSLRTGIARSPSRMMECLYTCGVCFKSFKAKVSLDQHCIQLHHWACVRCGRFFASFTSLGQHKLDVRHII